MTSIKKEVPVQKTVILSSGLDKNSRNNYLS